jgi:hypothetical protein
MTTPRWQRGGTPVLPLSPLCERLCLQRWGFDPAQLRDAVDHHDQRQDITFEGLRVVVYAKRILSKLMEPAWLLVFHHLTPAPECVQFALKAPSSLAPDFERRTPIEMAELVLGEVGCRMPIGRSNGFLVLYERVELPPAGRQTIKLKGQPHARYSIVMTASPHGPREMSVALAFAVGDDLYAEYLARHGL